MLVLEAALEQEQAMHGVTKAQLASLREDNQRLRQQLHAIRRHTVVHSEPATLVFCRYFTPCPRKENISIVCITLPSLDIFS